MSYPAGIDVDALKQLSTDKDAEFDEMLEDAAFDLIFENPVFKTQYDGNVRIIRGQGHEDDKKEAAKRNRSLLNLAKQLILDHVGISDVVVDEFEHARVQVAKIIEEDIRVNGENADALAATGIVKVDAEGNERFTYPRDLFPHSTTEKWHVYLSAVKSHVAAADYLSQNGRNGQGLVKETDRSRRVAHNAVSRDIQVLLALPDTAEGFEEARKLVVKMRKKRFPTQKTGERARVENSIKTGLGSNSVREFIRGSYTGMVIDPESASYERNLHHR